MSFESFGLRKTLISAQEGEVGGNNPGSRPLVNVLYALSYSSLQVIPQQSC